MPLRYLCDGQYRKTIAAQRHKQKYNKALTEGRTDRFYVFPSHDRVRFDLRPTSSTMT